MTDRYSDTLALITIAIGEGDTEGATALLGQLDEIVGERLVETENTLLADLGMTWAEVPVHVAIKHHMIELA